MVGEKQQFAFMQHYKVMRRKFKTSTFLYQFENNLGKEHDRLKLMIKDQAIFGNNVDYLYESEKMVGFRTKDTTKADACHLLRQIISIGAMSFYSEFITINPDAERGAAGMTELLFEQISNLREFTKEKINGQFTHFISGKHDERGVELKGRKDDAQMACGMALLYSRKFLDDELPVNQEAIENKIYKRMHMEEDPDFLAQVNKKRRLDAHVREMDDRATGVYGNNNSNKRIKL